MEANKTESKLTIKSLNKKFEDFLESDKQYKEENEKNISIISGVLNKLLERLENIEFRISKLEQETNKNNKILTDNIIFLKKNVDTLNNSIISITERTTGLENNVKTNISDSKTINDNMEVLTKNLNIVKEEFDNYLVEKNTLIENISNKNNTLDTLKNLINDIQYIVNLKEQNKI